MTINRSTLTSQIRGRAGESPLRRYLMELLPNHGAVRREFQRDCPQPLVTSGVDPVRSSWLGTAFDIAIAFLSAEDHDAQIAVAAPDGIAADVGEELVHLCRTEAAAWRETKSGPISGLMARACWALALSTTLYREAERAHDEVAAWRNTPDPCLDWALTLVDVSESSADYLQILRDLTGVAAVNLAHLRDPAAHVSTEVTFSGSFFVPADADLLVDTRLIEIKSGIGRSGSVLRDRDVYQLAGYALFDLKDELGITDVSFYSARHGHEVTWSLDRYLELMAGHPLDVGVARRHVEQIIITGEYPEDPFEAIQEARLF